MERAKKKRGLRCAIKSLAWKMLEQIADSGIRGEYKVEVKNGGVKLIVMVTSSVSNTVVEKQEGLWLSPIEAALINALETGGCKIGCEAMSGKVLAKRVAQEYDTRLKYILQNLESRQLIHLIHGQSYRIGPYQESSETLVEN